MGDGLWYPIELIDRDASVSVFCPYQPASLTYKWHDGKWIENVLLGLKISPNTPVRYFVAPWIEGLASFTLPVDFSLAGLKAGNTMGMRWAYLLNDEGTEVIGLKSCGVLDAEPFEKRLENARWLWAQIPHDLIATRGGETIVPEGGAG